MTMVFVYGNPESEALWGPLLAELGRDDVLRLSPPGFGSPVPDGFGATVPEYRDDGAGPEARRGGHQRLPGRGRQRLSCWVSC
jgi:pimeloyl-ACP methyl ester carboxylesterase